MAPSFRSLVLACLRCAAGRRARAGGTIGSAVALAFSCGVDSGPLFSEPAALNPAAGRPGNLPTYPPLTGLPGAGGREGGPGPGALLGEGAVGMAEQPQQETDAGTPDGGADRGDAGIDAGALCAQDADCEDGNGCTFDDCIQGSCQHLPADVGVACGSSTQNACTRADTCDGAGRCLSNDVPAGTLCGRTENTCADDACDGTGTCVAHDSPPGTECGSSSGCGVATCGAGGLCQPHDAVNGSACPGGSCSVGACVQGQRVGCPQQIASSVPFQMNWSSFGRPDLFRGGCQSNNTPDAALVFEAPAAGRYRFAATGSPDSVLAVVRGACGQGNNAELTCNDDLTDDNRASRIDLALTANQTVTVYVSEFGNGNTGSGTLSISAL